jgi:hypothetical protein
MRSFVHPPAWVSDAVLTHEHHRLIAAGLSRGCRTVGEIWLLLLHTSSSRKEGTVWLPATQESRAHTSDDTELNYT